MPRKRKRKPAADTAAIEEAGLVDAPEAEVLKQYEVTYRTIVQRVLTRRVLARSNPEAISQVRAAAESRGTGARVSIITVHLAEEE